MRPLRRKFLDGRRHRSRRPFLFIHIPKTAGTSLLTSLGAVFGESHTWRLSREEEEKLAEGLSLLTSKVPVEIDCISGHVPLHYFVEHMDNFRVFTVLRHPVERVFSLFRFLQRQPSVELSRLDLCEGFTFEQFVESRSAELFGQIRNGMCRMLSATQAHSDSTDRIFWQERLPIEAVEQAVGMLGKIEFGIMEAMSDTMATLGRMLGTPFELTANVENISQAPGDEVCIRNILKVVELNTHDITLYQSALDILNCRRKKESASVYRPRKPDIVRITHLNLNKEVQICNVARRIGFHAYEPKMEFCWISCSNVARMEFGAAPSVVSMRVKVYRVVDEYPMNKVKIIVNGRALTHRWTRHDEGWGLLESDPFEANPVNSMEWAIPYSKLVRELNPKSPDRRRLSIAVATVMLVSTSA